MQATHTLKVDSSLSVDVSVREFGRGRPILLLHGGAGPQSVAGFAELLATSHPARVITPTHPGFGGTPRPEGLKTALGLAATYVALLEALDLTGVTVVGNSIGGWIAAEMGLLRSPRVSSLVLVAATGIDVPEHPMADFFSLTPPEIAKKSFHDPSKFPMPAGDMPPAQREVMAGNRASLALYGGAPAMFDPTLRARLQGIAVPTLVVWGESDRIVVPEYGRAYAAAIPNATFELLRGTGHVPQVETPQQLVGPVWAFAESHATVA